LNQITEQSKLAQLLLAHLSKAILGKADCLELVVIALLCEGHILLEDVPGVGKTTLAHSLARSLHLGFSRIQCTPDLLPSDLVGANVFHPSRSEFEFRKGPLHQQVVLVDEINRATPKTQSALLECMEEKQITVDGTTHPLPVPFLVFATQNPIEFHGTYPLPEAQLDRFLLRVSLGYPDLASEMALLDDPQDQRRSEGIDAILTLEQLRGIQQQVHKVTCQPKLRNYLVALVRATRVAPGIDLGASPRGSLALFRTSQARAFLKGRDYILPDDIQAMVGPVLGHRLSGSRLTAQRRLQTLESILSQTEVPID
jgi:MoxR-like ATPase